jgi:hypothetical protein
VWDFLREKRKKEKKVPRILWRLLAVRELLSSHPFRATWMKKRIILGSSGDYSPRNDTELPLSKLQRRNRKQRKNERNQEEDLLWKMLEPSKSVHDPKRHKNIVVRAS